MFGSLCILSDYFRVIKMKIWLFLEKQSNNQKIVNSFKKVVLGLIGLCIFGQQIM